MNLTEQQILQTYELLDKMYVKLEAHPDRPMGLAYIKERATFCRATLDQVHDLRLKVGRAYSWVQEQLIYRKSALHLAGSDQEKEQLKIQIAELEAQKVSHATLNRLVQAQASVLNGANRDIRLLADVTLKQMKLGDIDPNEAESLVHNVSYDEMARMGEEFADVGGDSVERVMGASTETALFAQQDHPPTAPPPQQPTDTPGQPAQPQPVPTPPVPQPPTPAPSVPSSAAPVDDLAGLFRPTPQMGTFAPTGPVVSVQVTGGPGGTPQFEMGGFDAPVTAAESAPRGIRVPDMTAIPFESLIPEEVLNGGTAAAGGTSPVNRAF